jgi:hypothetical protein
MSKLLRSNKPKKYREKILDDHHNLLVKDVSSPMYVPDLSRDTLEKIETKRKWAKYESEFLSSVKHIGEECLPLKDTDRSIVRGDVFEPLNDDIPTFRVTDVDAKSHIAFCTKARIAKFSDLLNPDMYCCVLRGSREENLNKTGNNSLIISQMDTSPSSRAVSTRDERSSDIVVKSMDKSRSNVFKLVDVPPAEPDDRPVSPGNVPDELDLLSYTSNLRSDQSLMELMPSNEDKVSFIYQKSCDLLAIQPAARTVVRQLRKCVPSERFVSAADDDASVSSQVSALSAGGPSAHYEVSASYRTTAVGPEKGNSLSLRNLSLGNVQSCAILKSVQVLDTLQELDLTGNRLDENGAVSMIKSLRNVTGLQSIVLDNNKVGKKGVLALVALLERRPLDVYDEMLRSRWSSLEDDSSVGTMGSSWASVNSVSPEPGSSSRAGGRSMYTSIVPSPLSLGAGAGAGGSADSVASMSTIATWNSMGSASLYQSPTRAGASPSPSASALSSAYKANGSRLTPLGGGKGSLSSPALLSKHTGEGQPLELFASDNSVAGRNSLASIPDSISAPPLALRKLFLNDNKLGDIMVARLVKCLMATCLDTLTELGIRSNQCAVKTTRALTLMITGQPAVTLGSPIRSPKAEQKPPENTTPCCSLRYLDLGWNSFSDSAIISIFGAPGGAFAVANCLEILLLDWNGISDRCLPLLERLALGNTPGPTTVMKHLSLENNPIPVPQLLVFAARAESVECKVSYSSFHFEKSTFDKLVIQKPNPIRNSSVMISSPTRNGSMAVTPSKKR